MTRLGIAGVVGVLGLGLLSPAAGLAAPAAAPPSGAIVVGTVSPTCPRPTFAAIQPAVDAAPANGTVYVCAGTYTGPVSITKPVKLLGAQSGRDARSGRTALPAESVVTSPSGGFVVNGTVNGFVVDGFTFRGSTGDGIDALGLGSGFSIVNNVFEDNQNGMNVNAAGTAPSTIARNRFTANNRGADGPAGTGILFTSGAANNVTVSDNLFERHSEAGVNNIAGTGLRSTNLVVRNNRSVDDSSFAVVNNTSNALIDQNQATKAASAIDGTIIYIVGNNDRLTIRRNVLSGDVGTGISANAAFGSVASTNLLIDTNVIRDRTTGIAINDDHRTVTVRGNVVQGSTRNGASPGRGIAVSAASSGIVLTNNVATGSSDVDCVDASKGSRTVGTANTWTNDVGRTSSPGGLCIPGRPVTLPAPPLG